jgi:hypothetical protein
MKKKYKAYLLDEWLKPELEIRITLQIYGKKQKKFST